jgi:hypothetical protein
MTLALAAISAAITAPSRAGLSEEIDQPLPALLAHRAPRGAQGIGVVALQDRGGERDAALPDKVWIDRHEHLKVVGVVRCLEFRPIRWFSVTR